MQDILSIAFIGWFDASCVYLLLAFVLWVWERETQRNLTSTVVAPLYLEGSKEPAMRLLPPVPQLLLLPPGSSERRLQTRKMDPEVEAIAPPEIIYI